MYTTTTWRPRHAARSLNQIIKVVAKIHHTWQRHVHVDEEEYDDAAFFSLSSELRHYSGKHPDWEQFYRRVRA